MTFPNSIYHSPLHFFNSTTLCSIPSHLCWQLTTPKSPWKASRGFKLLSLKVPLKAFPLWCEECYRSSWKLTSAAIYCAGFCHYVEDKYGFHHEQNEMWPQKKGSCGVTDPETGQIASSDGDGDPGCVECRAPITPLPSHIHTPTHQSDRLHRPPVALTKSSSVNDERWPVT